LRAIARAALKGCATVWFSVSWVSSVSSPSRSYPDARLWSGQRRGMHPPRV